MFEHVNTGCVVKTKLAAGDLQFGSAQRKSQNHCGYTCEIKANRLRVTQIKPE